MSSRNEYVSSPVASKITGISSQSLRAWAREGKLRTHRTTAGHWRYHRDDLEAFRLGHGLRPDSTMSALLDQLAVRGEFTAAEAFRHVGAIQNMHIHTAQRLAVFLSHVERRCYMGYRVTKRMRGTQRFWRVERLETDDAS